MEGDETSAGAGEEWIAEIGQRPRIAAEAAGDDIGGEVEDGVLGWRGDIHRGIYGTAVGGLRHGGGAMKFEIRNSNAEPAKSRRAGEESNPKSE
jgi:hypothetical protein